MSFKELTPAKVENGEDQPLTYGDFKELVNKLSDEQLKQPLRLWGFDGDEGWGALIYGVQELEEDFVDPNGDGFGPLSEYKAAITDFEIDPEDPIYPAGTLILQADKYSKNS